MVNLSKVVTISPFQPLFAVFVQMLSSQLHMRIGAFIVRHSYQKSPIDINLVSNVIYLRGKNEAPGQI